MQGDALTLCILVLPWDALRLTSCAYSCFVRLQLVCQKKHPYEQAWPPGARRSSRRARAPRRRVQELAMVRCHWEQAGGSHMNVARLFVSFLDGWGRAGSHGAVTCRQAGPIEEGTAGGQLQSILQPTQPDTRRPVRTSWHCLGQGRGRERMAWGRQCSQPAAAALPPAASGCAQPGQAAIQDPPVIDVDTHHVDVEGAQVAESRGPSAVRDCAQMA